MLLTIESLKDLNSNIVQPVIEAQYHTPVWFDIAATFLFAITGSVKAIDKGYDYIGLLTLALVSSVGGGIIRDLLLDVGPPVALKNYFFLVAVMCGAVVAVLFYNQLHHIRRLIIVVDALSLGIYAVVGAQKTIDVGLNVLAAMIIGFMNASFGGVIRDVLMNEEPQLFKPGQFYAAAAVAGLSVYMALVVGFEFNSYYAATICIIVTTIIRLLSLKYNWKTHSFKRFIKKK
ncbi:MAG: trimeric intracellular cation channel family protein [Bacteroidia bacterium]